ncbi:MAG: hypothetical protein M1829_001862 [Trizodia sp. TS-e1964]|nr:MAG: hypothetical protein M1829_001862 [Trizodia sp. TS-e1964]
MARKPRAAAQAAAASIKTVAPPIIDQSDEDLDLAIDAPDTPQEDATPPPRDEPLSASATPAPGQTPNPRKRRLGRPPKNKPPGWDAAEDIGTIEGTSEAGTPLKKRRGRPPAAGSGRWKSRGGPSHVTQVPIDKEGNMMDVIDDEVALPEDVEGETKVDKNGHLQNGREYRCRTFTVLGRGNRLYMLSTEPARCIGFRDSYLFFQKHKTLYKIIIEDHEKRDLIDRQVIPHSYKGRAIGIVTARSVFREFGARIVVGGRKVIDDYHAQAARNHGDVEGELADPNDRLPAAGENYNKNQYVAWHGASSVYHSGQPTLPIINGKVLEGKKKKVVVTDVNWMLEHAKEAGRFNSSLTVTRRQNNSGVYDPHTNFMQMPAIMQPTHVRWKQLLTSPTTSAGIGKSSLPKILLTNGTPYHAESAEVDKTGQQDSEASFDTIFPPIPPVYTRNFFIADIIFQPAPRSNLGIPGPGIVEEDFGHHGLLGVPDDVVAELPFDCLESFKEAREQELKWKMSWGTESEECARQRLRIGY